VARLVEPLGERHHAGVVLVGRETVRYHDNDIGVFIQKPASGGERRAVCSPQNRTGPAAT